MTKQRSMPLHVFCYWGLVCNTLAKEHRAPGFSPRYRQISSDLFIYLFGVLRRFQHCTGHITTGSWKGRGNQYIQFARAVYCKLPTNGKQLPAFPLKAMTGMDPRPQRWEARVLPLCQWWEARVLPLCQWQTATMAPE